jgi:hypothetical protein
MYQAHCLWVSWTKQQHSCIVGEIETTGGKFLSKKFTDRKKLKIFGRYFGSRTPEVLGAYMTGYK